ncbi:hypothetical protein THASP1DRAFT_31913 [Thamnocephalis sphaerospora]|uniref:Uncharacterized protein n=1 Tax=Thamnocephalis sphaerospora TaxID=78915 RepID=A0A4P9XKD8_9FUNG|nr:hypothetical protein THASP1DRAFT_31913 [Thamnocephalis sphaerospora]|eukprot:RKP06263.1 hypothetical protein THASP1DRAFT_31913 [Thamnocephalis sphaerospora]
MKYIKFVLAQAVATIAAVAISVQAIALDSRYDEVLRDPVQHLFGNGFYSISENMGATWELVGSVNRDNSPTGPTWEFLNRPAEYHHFRDGCHLISHDVGVTWHFFRCEADPFTRQRELDQGWGLDMPQAIEDDEHGNTRVSCDGGVTWTWTELRRVR